MRSTDGIYQTPPPEQVAFVIPAHDEAGAIADVVRRCRAVGCAADILVVDDGSRDTTGAEAIAAGARSLRLSPNRGKGVALRAGLEAVDAPFVVVLDGDGQDPPEEAPRLLAALADADLVIGSRFLGTLEPGSIRPLNRAANVALTALMAGLYGQRITDSQAGFRAARREAWLGLPTRAARYDVETEVLALALRRGLRVVEVPVTRHPRAAGQTKLPRVATGLRVLRTMARCRLA